MNAQIATTTQAPHDAPGVATAAARLRSYPGLLATVGIVTFSEMSGRVAAVAKQPVFNLMRHRLGLKLGLLTLAASIVSNLITCAAEVGGVALILNYMSGFPYVAPPHDGFNAALKRTEPTHPPSPAKDGLF